MNEYSNVETKGEKEARKRIYMDGLKARRDGFAVSVNPYPEESSKSGHWFKGWMAGGGRG